MYSSLLTHIPIRRSAGNWLFRGRRWLDPANPEDRNALNVNYDRICIQFPEFEAACRRDKFIAALGAVAGRWAALCKNGQDASRLSKHTPTPLAAIPVDSSDLGPSLAPGLAAQAARRCQTPPQDILDEGSGSSSDSAQTGASGNDDAQDSPDDSCSRSPSAVRPSDAAAADSTRGAWDGELLCVGSDSEPIAAMAALSAGARTGPDDYGSPVDWLVAIDVEPADLDAHGASAACDSDGAHGASAGLEADPERTRTPAGEPDVTAEWIAAALET